MRYLNVIVMFLLNNEINKYLSDLLFGVLFIVHTSKQILYNMVASKLSKRISDILGFYTSVLFFSLAILFRLKS